MRKVIAIVVLFVFSSSLASAVLRTRIDAANFLASKDIIVDQSSSPLLYELDKEIQRKAVMKIVMKLSGKKVPNTCRGEFDDVDKNDWPCKYIEAALDAGYIAKNTNFRPSDNITLTEAMKLVLKSKGIQKTQTTSNWQEDYMMTAYEYGIIDEKYFNYNDNASRGWIFQIATSTIEQEVKIFKAGGIISGEVIIDDEASYWNTVTGTLINTGGSFDIEEY